VIPSQNFLNIIIRNSEIVQVFEDSQILLASSSGLLCVSWLRNLIPGSIIFLRSPFYHLDFMRKFCKSEKNSQHECRGSQNFKKFELKIVSIRIIRIIRKNSLIRIIRIFGQRINRYATVCDDSKYEFWSAVSCFVFQLNRCD